MSRLDEQLEMSRCDGSDFLFDDRRRCDATQSEKLTRVNRYANRDLCDLCSGLPGSSAVGKRKAYLAGIFQKVEVRNSTSGVGWKYSEQYKHRWKSRRWYEGRR